jgi:hypothetical protein
MLWQRDRSQAASDWRHAADRSQHLPGYCKRGDHHRHNHRRDHKKFMTLVEVGKIAERRRQIDRVPHATYRASYRGSVLLISAPATSRHPAR